jgi:hypothetical protein
VNGAKWCHDAPSDISGCGVGREESTLVRAVLRLEQDLRTNGESQRQVRPAREGNSLVLIHRRTIDPTHAPEFRL